MYCHCTADNTICQTNQITITVDMIQVILGTLNRNDQQTNVNLMNFFFLCDHLNYNILSTQHNLLTEFFNLFAFHFSNIFVSRKIIRCYFCLVLKNCICQSCIKILIWITACE